METRRGFATVWLHCRVHTRKWVADCFETALFWELVKVYNHCGQWYNHCSIITGVLFPAERPSCPNPFTSSKTFPGRERRQSNWQTAIHLVSRDTKSTQSREMLLMVFPAQCRPTYSPPCFCYQQQPGWNQQSSGITVNLAALPLLFHPRPCSTRNWRVFSWNKSKAFSWLWLF